MRLTVASVSLNLTGQQWGKNLDLIAQAIDEAIQYDVDILSFAELTLTSASCGDYYKFSDNQSIRQLLDHIARYAQLKKPELVLSIGHPWFYANKQMKDEACQRLAQYNRLNTPFIVQSLIQQGEILSMSAKSHFDERRYEHRHFNAWNDADETVFITLSDKTNIPFGQPIVPLVIRGETITIAQIIGDTKQSKTMSATVILNPVASFPQYILNAQESANAMSQCVLFVKTNHIGNHGGECAYQGEQLIAYRKAKHTHLEIAAARYAGFHDVTMTYAAFEVDLVKQVAFCQSEKVVEQISDVQLETINDALWLFDYLRKYKLKTIVQAFSGGFNSVFNAIKIRLMVEIASESLGGVDVFVKTMGYSPDLLNDMTTQEAQVDAVMHELLICVYCVDEKTRAVEQANARALVEKIGARFFSRNIQTLLEQCVLFHSDVSDPDVITKLKDRCYALMALSVGNFTPASVGITNTNLDKLCLNQTIFGGNLHAGQLGILEKTWRIEQHEQLEWLNTHHATFKGVLTELLMREGHTRIRDARTRQILNAILHHRHETGRKLNPIEVFVQLSSHPLFKDDDIEALYLTIKHHYQSFAKAQLHIHAAPLSTNYHGKAVNHDLALRTPNLNGFHEAELAQLTLYCLDKQYPGEQWQQQYGDHALLNKAFIKQLLNQQSLVRPQSLTRCPETCSRDPVSTGTAQEIKIAMASCNQTARDWARNVANICHAIDKAIEDNAALLCLQELGLSGYCCDDDFEYTDNALTHRLLQHIADYAVSKNPQLMISIGHPWILTPLENPLSNPNHKPFDVQSLLVAGEIIAMSAKSYLFNYERGYEKRYFQEWNNDTIQITLAPLNEKAAKTIPFGSPVIEVMHHGKPLTLFHVICEESWIGSEEGDRELYARTNPLAIKNRQSPIHIAINPNASPSSSQKIHTHRFLAEEGSRHCGVFVHVNFMGTESSSIVGLGTQLIAQQGVIIAEALPLSTHDVSYSSKIVRIFDDCHPERSEGSLIWRDPELELELRSELLWLFDMMRKQGVQGFVQALSGGADSAYNSAKIYLMAQLVIKERGLSDFLNELNYPHRLQKKIRSAWPIAPDATGDAVDLFDAKIQQAIHLLMKYMLQNVYLATQNNSLKTRQAAQALVNGAHGIGGQFHIRDIQPVMDALLLTFSGLDPFLPRDKKKALLEKLRFYAGLRKDDLQVIYNDLLQHTPDFIPCLWPQGTETLSFEDKQLAKEKEEQRLIHALEAHFRQEIASISGQEIDASITILSPINSKHGLTLENMQARIRLVLSYLITDCQNAQASDFVIEMMVNPNQSEGRNAYTTLCGDLHTGRWSPNSHKEKAHQLRQMALLRDHGLHGIPSLRAFEEILKDNKPTAELQGKSYGRTQLAAVKQFDEDALGRTYEEMEIIGRLMMHTRAPNAPERYANPIEVFEMAHTHYFKGMPIPVLHDKLLTAYKYWPTAQHKLVCSPVSMTWGSENIDHKLSSQTPCLNAFHQGELAQLTLYCLAKMAHQKGILFEQLTEGLSLESMLSHALVDLNFANELDNQMWGYTNLDCLSGVKERKIEILYRGLAEKKPSVMNLFILNACEYTVND